MAGSVNAKPRPRELKMSKMDNKPSKIQQDVRLWAGVERTRLKLSPGDEDIPCGKQDGLERILPENIQSNDEIMSEERESDEQILLREFADIENSFSDEGEGDDQFSPQEMPDVEVTPNEELECDTRATWNILSDDEDNLFHERKGIQQISLQAIVGNDRIPWE